MKISLPINRFKFKNNKIFVNDLIVEYENVSEDTQEILESLISKGAYGTALLTLNMFYNVKSFNGAGFTHSDYLNYLGECNKLLKEKECLVEASEALSFKPLINLNGLEIMESDNYIARGKNNKLFVEDFRSNKVLCEGSEILVTYDVPNEEAALEIANDSVFFDPGEEVLVRDWNGHEYKVTKTEQTPVEKKKEKVATVNESKEETKTEYQRYCDDLGIDPKKRSSKNRFIKDYGKHQVTMNGIKDFNTKVDQVKKDLQEEAEGTQTTDIAEKKDQSVGSLQKPKKRKKLIVKENNVPRNHGFKGFMMCESGYYERGNYALVKEGNKIKAVRKDSLGI